MKSDEPPIMTNHSLFPWVNLKDSNTQGASFRLTHQMLFLEPIYITSVIQDQELLRC